MNEDDYRSWETSLLADYRQALEEFASSKNNVEVYALVIQFHSYYGGPVLALNTELGYENIVAKYPDESTFQVCQFGGSRWNPPEFAFFDFAQVSAETERFDKRFRSHIERVSDIESVEHANALAESLIRVVQRLSAFGDRLNKTPGFVSYVWMYDASESEQLELTRQTIQPGLFARLFPEVHESENFLEEIATRPESGQVLFWSDAITDLFLERDTSLTRKFEELGLSRYEAIEAFIAIGPTAIPELVRIAEEHALADEWNERGSAEWERRGAATLRGSLASSALLALESLDDGPEEVVERLQMLLQRLHDRDRNLALAGVNGQLTARALHSLRPKQFPPTRFSDTNHVLNIADYLP